MMKLSNQFWVYFYGTYISRCILICVYFIFLLLLYNLETEVQVLTYYCIPDKHLKLALWTEILKKCF